MGQEFPAQALEQAPQRLTDFVAVQLLFQVDDKSASRSPFRMSGVVDLLLKSGASRSVRLATPASSDLGDCEWTRTGTLIQVRHHRRRPLRRRR